MFISSYNFLTKTTGFLRNQTRLGYDRCHHIQNYDARKCERDCKKLAKSEFAKKCESRNGLFKCCIRYRLYSIKYEKA